ncbi:MAG TPA: nucleotidyltransferase domain-containing protein [Geminicoccaceae bacterium]|nr:nucleotidyltransferase domain-containing protein [Geminicoccaceae bacterium]
MSNDLAFDRTAGGAADRPGWHPAVAWLTNRLAAIPSVERVVLFGSRARGDHRPRSDIDLAVEAPEASTEDRARMVELVEDAPTLLAIDLVRLDTAEPALRGGRARGDLAP